MLVCSLDLDFAQQQRAMHPKLWETTYGGQRERLPIGQWLTFCLSQRERFKFLTCDNRTIVCQSRQKKVQTCR